MYFRLTAVVALLSAPLFALAQSPNAFNIPSNFAPAPGVPTKLEWTPTTDGTISLQLRWGSSTDLAKGISLVSGYQNSGEYTWTPSTSLPRRSDYAIEIIDDEDPSQVNYTPPFALDTSNAGSGSSSASASASITGSTIVDSSSGSPTATPTGSASSTSASSSGATMTEGSSSSSASATPASSSSDGASFQGTAASSSAMSQPSQGSAPRVTAVARMLGAVALGALAL